MIGIVVLNFQKWDETEECLKSIIENHIDEKDYAICVVDNNSTNPISESLSRLIDSQDNIHLLLLDSNKGYAYGNNRGWELLDQKYALDSIIISNSDIIFHSNSIKAIEDFFVDKLNDGYIVFPKIFSPNGNVSYIDDHYYTSIRQIYSRVLNKRQFYGRSNAIDMDSVIPVQTYLNMGACFAVNKEAINKCFPLDENTTLYFEEMILSRKADSLGVKIFYLPNSIVLHKEGQSTGKANPFADMCHDESIMYYSRRYIKANKFACLPLFIVLIMKFRIKCIKNKRYRSYYKQYINKLRMRWNNSVT